MFAYSFFLISFVFYCNYVYKKGSEGMGYYQDTFVKKKKNSLCIVS